MTADLLLRGATIRPLGRHGLRGVTHLAVAGGRVLAAGGSEVEGLRGPRTRVVDLDGRHVLPGFDDAHAHVVYYGLTSFGADLTGSRSLAELAGRVAAAHQRLAPGRWLVARGYSPLEMAEGRPPTRHELDSVTGERPAYADERGGHSRVANTAALRAAGIDRNSEDPPGGAIGRDESGAPDGRLLEAAMRLVSDVQPAPPLAERKLGIQRCLRLLARRGITSVGAAVNRGFADDLRAFTELDRDRRLGLRVHGFLSWELLPAAETLGLRAAHGGRVTAGPIKVFVDGGASAGAAAFRSGGGTWRTPPGQLHELVRRATEAGLQVAAHAIGDAAIEAMCDAVEAAGPAARSLRHRVEHCTACPGDLRTRLSRLGMVAVMQPGFVALARDRVLASGAFPAGLADDLAAHSALLRAGVPVAFSSDLPVTPEPDPWLGIAAAVLDSGQPLSLLQALRAYTAGGAFAAFAEHRRGTLEPGMVADFQVHDLDPLAWVRAARSQPSGRLQLKGPRPSAVAVAGAPILGRF